MMLALVARPSLPVALYCLVSTFSAMMLAKPGPFVFLLNSCPL